MAELGILGEWDQPCARMVVIRREVKGEWIYDYVSALVDCKLGAIAPPNWTALSDFGCDASVKQSRLWVTQIKDSTASYSDGVSRQWQGGIEGSTNIKPRLVRAVAGATP